MTSSNHENDEITDDNLNARLKSLNSFINNLDPSSPPAPTSTEDTVQQQEATVINNKAQDETVIASSAPILDNKNSESNSSQYYEQVCEKAAATNDHVNFNKLLADVHTMDTTRVIIDPLAAMTISKVSAPGKNSKIL